MNAPWLQSPGTRTETLHLNFNGGGAPNPECSPISIEGPATGVFSFWGKVSC